MRDILDLRFQNLRSFAGGYFKSPAPPPKLQIISSCIKAQLVKVALYNTYLTSVEADV